MHYADSMGAGKICDAISRFQKRPGLEYWSVPDLLDNLVTKGTGFADLSGGK
jgi:hypothetical protein